MNFKLWLLESVSLCPKVIPLSGACCINLSKDASNWQDGKEKRRCVTCVFPDFNMLLAKTFLGVIVYSFNETFNKWIKPARQ